MGRFLILSTLVLFVLVNNGCDKKPCPKQVFPKLKLPHKIKRNVVYFGTDGSLSVTEAQKLGNTASALYVVQDYHINQILAYRTYVKKQTKIKKK